MPRLSSKLVIKVPRNIFKSPSIDIETLASLSDRVSDVILILLITDWDLHCKPTWCGRLVGAWPHKCTAFNEFLSIYSSLQWF